MADATVNVDSDASFVPKVINVAVPDSAVAHPPPYDPNRIASVTSDLHIFDKYVTYTDNTVTISGPITDVFSKTIDYLAADNTIKTVALFEDIPADQLAVIKYVAPTPQIKTVMLTINFLYDDPPFTIEVTVVYNYALANAALVDAVKKGKF